MCQGIQKGFLMNSGGNGELHGNTFERKSYK